MTKLSSGSLWWSDRAHHIQSAAIEFLNVPKWGAIHQTNCSVPGNRAETFEHRHIVVCDTPLPTSHMSLNHHTHRPRKLFRRIYEWPCLAHTISKSSSKHLRVIDLWIICSLRNTTQLGADNLTRTTGLNASGMGKTRGLHYRYGILHGLGFDAYGVRPKNSGAWDRTRGLQRQAQKLWWPLHCLVIVQNGIIVQKGASSGLKPLPTWRHHGF